jgi:SAM-dependent methyltransferase
LSGNGFGNRAEADSATRTSLIAACAEKLPFEDGRFPVVVADSLMEHTDDPVAALAEMVRVLRPGGVLHIWSPNRLWIGPDPHVGLVGLPLLPRGWARRYVKARRGPVHWPESRSPAEWAALLRRSGAAFVTIRPGAADLSGWPVSDSSLRGRSARTLGRLTRWPVASVLLRTIGPIGEVIVRKSANDEAMRPAEHESPELSP